MVQLVLDVVLALVFAHLVLYHKALTVKLYAMKTYVLIAVLALVLAQHLL